MGKYKYENGKYYRQASNGNWFEVTRDANGIFYWIQPDGKRVYDSKVGSAPVQGEKMSFATTGGGSGKFVPQGMANVVSLTAKPKSDPSENFLNDILFGALAAGPALIKGASETIPAVTKSVASTNMSVPVVQMAYYTTPGGHIIKTAIPQIATKTVSLNPVLQAITGLGLGAGMAYGAKQAINAALAEEEAKEAAEEVKEIKEEAKTSSPSIDNEPEDNESEDNKPEDDKSNQTPRSKKPNDKNPKGNWRGIFWNTSKNSPNMAPWLRNSLNTGRVLTGISTSAPIITDIIGNTFWAPADSNWNWKATQRSFGVIDQWGKQNYGVPAEEATSTTTALKNLEKQDSIIVDDTYLQQFNELFD